jgi:hypothetical protein
MALKPVDIAFMHAPVLWQKVSDRNPRGDFITAVDLGGDFRSIVKNWSLVKRKSTLLTAEAYYSVVETYTHYFILYAFYHGQDWYDGETVIHTFRKHLDEHLHDMEGALAIVAKRQQPAQERVDAFITISHFHFYCYANWMKTDKEPLFPMTDPWRDRIRGFREDLDGNIWPTKHDGLNRFSLYAQAKGHGIRGDRRRWGGEHRIIRYFPSNVKGEVPDLDVSREHKGYLFHGAHYGLIDMFGDRGLWGRKDDPKVFRANSKGQDAFVEIEEGGRKRVAGRANPPWGWDDIDDRHKCGELATNPAGIVHDYLKGMREFSLEYVHNPYLNVIKPGWSIGRP